MLRKLVIFIVMLIHINGSMFLPQAAEQDIYNEQGQQQKDINTVIEYIDEIILGNHDTNPVDQDNDQGQNFHLVKIVDYYFNPGFTTDRHKPALALVKQSFNVFREKKIDEIILDVLAPPPRP